MTDARTIIIEALGPEVPASWRKQVADRMFTALRSAGFEVCAVAAPTTDARTIIADGLIKAELRRNGQAATLPGPWFTLADDALAALRDAGFEVCAVAAPTIRDPEAVEAEIRLTLRLLDDRLSRGVVSEQVALDAAVGHLTEIACVASPTITPQRFAQIIQDLRDRDCDYLGHFKLGYDSALDDVLDVVGAAPTITPQPTDGEPCPTCGRLACGYLSTGDTTCKRPADQEDTDE